MGGRCWSLAGAVFCRRGRRRNGDLTVRNGLIRRLLFAAAALAAAMCCGDESSHPAGWRHEPWCAVIEYDDVTWDCSYRTFDACYQNVIAGNKGSCNPNPDGPDPQTAFPKPQKRHAPR